MSRVDVVIPCYNYARYLRTCVDSVLQQSGVDVRVLIIDDASSDNSAEIAAQLAAQDGRVSFRRHATNHGHIATYNEGLLDWCSADYALLISADDLLVSGALTRAGRCLDAHADVGLVYGRQVVFHTDEQLPSSQPATGDGSWDVIAGPRFIDSVCDAGANPVTTPTAVVRMELLKQMGGYRKELPHTADMELWLRFAAHSSIAIVYADQAYKRMHGHNMQVEYVATAIGDLQQRHAAFQIFFHDTYQSPALRMRRERAAKHSLADEAFWAASRAFDHGDARHCRALLDYALQLNPELRFRPRWFNLRLKQRLGIRAWAWLQPWVNRVRSRTRHYAPDAVCSS
jgi:glycosyltransferase involved in cell wall biosynthesis